MRNTWQLLAKGQKLLAAFDNYSRYFRKHYIFTLTFCTTREVARTLYMLWWKSPCELVIDKAIIFGKWWLLFTDKFSLYDSPGWLSPWATVRARRKEKKVKEAQRDYRLLTSAGSLPVQLSLKSTATPLTYWDYIITYIHQYYRQYCSATQKVKKKKDSNFYSRNKSTSYCCASSELQEIFAPKKKNILAKWKKK